MLQLDVIGDELKLWGWRAGDPRPDEPQITHIDPTYASGFVGIFINALDGNIGTFGFVQVADTSIPEPSSAVLACLGFACLLAWRRAKVESRGGAVV
jgi:hypothetical protein